MTNISELLQELLDDTSPEFFELYGAHHTRIFIPNQEGTNVGGNPKVRGDEDDFARGVAYGDEVQGFAARVASALLEGKEPPDNLTLDEQIAVAALAGDSVICGTKSISSQLLPRTLRGIRLSNEEQARIFRRVCTWIKSKDIEVMLAFMKSMDMDFIRSYNITRIPGFMEVIMPIREQLKNGYIRKNVDSYFHGIILGVKAEGRGVHEVKSTEKPRTDGKGKRIFYMFGSEDEVRALIPEVKEIYDTMQIVRG